MKCPNCGAENADSLVECPFCLIVFSQWAKLSLQQDAPRAPAVPGGSAAEPSPRAAPFITRREYAGYLRRIPARMIDGFVMMILFGVTKPALGVPEPALGLLWALNILYFIGLEWSPLRGTLGKKAMGLSVVDVSGGRISFVAANKRFWLMPVWMFWVWIRCAFAYLTGNKAYGASCILEKPFLHDRLAGTLVVKA
ncbi:MAG: RDD family protein [Elusimicrobia bacterium]|nr:RDD family protein [Elusimicrobiota bacterium]